MTDTLQAVREFLTRYAEANAQWFQKGDGLKPMPSPKEAESLLAALDEVDTLLPAEKVHRENCPWKCGVNDGKCMCKVATKELAKADVRREAFEAWHDRIFNLSAGTAVKTAYGYPQDATIQMRWQAWQFAWEARGEYEAKGMLKGGGA